MGGLLREVIHFLRFQFLAPSIEDALGAKGAESLLVEVLPLSTRCLFAPFIGSCGGRTSETVGWALQSRPQSQNLPSVRLTSSVGASARLLMTIQID